MGRPTVDDLAERAGVEPSTVEMIGELPISDRRKILEAMALEISGYAVKLAKGNSRVRNHQNVRTRAEMGRLATQLIDAVARVHADEKIAELERRIVELESPDASAGRTPIAGPVPIPATSTTNGSGDTE